MRRFALLLTSCSLLVAGCQGRKPKGVPAVDAAAVVAPAPGPSPTVVAPPDAAASGPGRDAFDDLADDVIEGIAVAHTPDGSVLVTAATRRGEGGLEEFIQFLSKDGVQNQLEVGDIMGTPPPELAANLARELRTGKFVALTYGRWPDGEPEAPVPEHDGVKLRWKDAKLVWVEGSTSLPVGEHAVTPDLEERPTAIWARDGAPVLAVTFSRSAKNDEEKGGAGDSTALYAMPAR